MNHATEKSLVKMSDSESTNIPTAVERIVEKNVSLESVETDVCDRSSEHSLKTPGSCKSTRSESTCGDQDRNILSRDTSECVLNICSCKESECVNTGSSDELCSEQSKVEACCLVTNNDKLSPVGLKQDERLKDEDELNCMKCPQRSDCIQARSKENEEEDKKETTFPQKERRNTEKQHVSVKDESGQSVGLEVEETSFPTKDETPENESQESEETEVTESKVEGIPKQTIPSSNQMRLLDKENTEEQVSPTENTAEECSTFLNEGKESEEENGKIEVCSMTNKRDDDIKGYNKFEKEEGMEQFGSFHTEMVPKNEEKDMEKKDDRLNSSSNSDLSKISTCTTSMAQKIKKPDVDCELEVRNNTGEVADLTRMNVHVQAMDNTTSSFTHQNSVVPCVKTDGDFSSTPSEYSPDSGDESDNLLSELENELDYSRAKSVQHQMVCSDGPKSAYHHNDVKRHFSNQYSERFQKHISQVNEDHATLQYYEVQVEFLERTNSQLQLELADLRKKLTCQEVDLKKNIEKLKIDLGSKIDKLTKQLEVAQKDKENMVVRYAQSEKEVLVAKKARDDLEKKLREVGREKENLQNRIKGLNSEKARLSGLLDRKVGDYNSLFKEYERLKEDITSKDIKIKWAQNRLKTEMDTHKETRAKLDQTLQRLQETREEAEQIRKDCQEMIGRYQAAEEIKSVSLDNELKAKVSELEAQRQEKFDQQEVQNLLAQELDGLKKKHKLAINENNALTVKIHNLEKERLEHEQVVSKLKDTQNSLRQDIVDLSAKLAEMENLQIQLDREKEKVAATQREVERLRQANADLQTDMESCHNKEGELLEFTERLTAKSVQLQSEHSSLETKAQTLEGEVARLDRLCEQLENKNEKLVSQLEEEMQQRQQETQLLARKLAEKTKLVEQLTVKLEEAENENKVMKRRHITSIKELSRELQGVRKRLEAYEANHHNGGESLSMGSRASSNGSLDILPGGQSANQHNTSSSPHVTPPVVFSSKKTSTTTVATQYSKAFSQLQDSGNQNSPSSTNNGPEINCQLLIERIVKLQKALARKNEKIDFLGEHNNHLIAELRKKSKIIQSYILREESGALIPQIMDQNKHASGKKGKIELSKRGGIMASVYSSHPSDSHMTLDLSLEINQKLQAVLEDTLLKNITLKENINTLGEEIARMSKEYRELQSQVQRNKHLTK
ncbi:coiled-coil domain-containing protein 186-like isoform X2 [Tachypleus tridentatus]|uniref:coiled-coil domain-containing protein 186-like isoform X2 n=1 Tax=Tachypleus tridentatus TaxID=6853 RepID=UPI003FD52F72